MNAATGVIACDLTVKNIRLVNMFTGEIYRCSVDVMDGRVVRIREPGVAAEQPARTVYDGQGAFLVPGFIDAHMHVESTMLIPENLSRAVVPWGTTTICADPHEIGNVLGVDGVRFMLNNAKRSTLRQYNLCPSCVPAVPEFESSGATFGAHEVGELLDEPDVIGIGEIMDMAGVCAWDNRMSSILNEGMKRDLFLQGHAAGLSGEALAAYRLGGPVSDHEVFTSADLLEKLRSGMHINARYSSIITNIEEQADGLRDLRWKDFISVCTDDKYARDIAQTGHVNHVVGRLIACGVDALEAYRMATLNAAREYGFRDLGAIAPGYWADMQLLETLDGRQPKAVFIAGELVAQDGVYLGRDIPSDIQTLPHTVNTSQITDENSLRLRAPAGCGDEVTVNVICREPGVWHINHLHPIRLPVRDGFVDISDRPDLCYLCVANRYGSGELVVGLHENFGLTHGALGSTISHDSHNLTVFYRTPQEGFLAAKTLVDCGGGMCVVEGETVAAVLELPVAGLMSPRPLNDVVAALDRLDTAYARLREDDFSVMRSSALSLPCVPYMLITNRGLVDGTQQRFVPLFPEYACTENPCASVQ